MKYNETGFLRWVAAAALVFAVFACVKCGMHAERERDLVGFVREYQAEQIGIYEAMHVYFRTTRETLCDGPVDLVTLPRPWYRQTGIGVERDEAILDKRKSVRRVGDDETE